MVARADDNRFATIVVMVFPLADHFTVAIAMTVTDGNANTRGANTDPDFFRTGRHRNGNRGNCDGSHYHMLDHRLLLLDEIISDSIRGNVGGSVVKTPIMRRRMKDPCHRRAPNQTAAATIATTIAALPRWARPSSNCHYAASHCQRG
jgi:hypothetical protein